MFFLFSINDIQKVLSIIVPNLSADILSVLASLFVSLQKNMYFCNVKKKLLYEVSIIRPLIIFLLVVYHSLCVFTGGWPAPAGVPENAAYWWLGRTISGFRIETIAFVGGYVFCYQCVELLKRQRFFQFVWKKFKRLIIPCFVFGIVYYLLYRFNPSRFSWYVAFWRVANGIGHLWFLPMLFWCFLAGWLTDRLLSWLSQYGRGAQLGLAWGLLGALAVVSMLRITGLKMGLSRAPYFFFYFYLGYFLRFLSRGRQVVFGRGSVVALWALYVAFLLLHLQMTKLHLPGLWFDCPKVLRGASLTLIHALNLGHTTCGILALYGSVSRWLARHKTSDDQPGAFLRQCSRLCYGVYVLHMFFMQPIYFFSPFPAWCCGSALGVWLMPWLVLAVTLLLSVVSTLLLLKTRFGRFLIG